MKKTLAALLAIIFVLSVFVGCGGGKNNDDSKTTTAGGSKDNETTAGEVTTAEEPPFYTQVNFDGTEIVVACRDEYTNFVLGEEGGDVFFSSIYETNKKLDELLGVKLSYEFGNADTGPFVSASVRSILGNDASFDLVMPDQYHGSAYIVDGAFQNVNALDTDKNYLDLDNDCWYHYYHNNLQLENGALYFLSGDLSPTILGWTGCTYVNVAMYNDIFGEDSINDFLDDVEAGKWTVDCMIEKCQAAYLDVNGNQRVDKEDRLGGCVTAGQSGTFACVAAGATFSRRDNDGNLILGGDDETTLTAIEKVQQLYAYTTGFYTFTFSGLGNLLDSQKFAADECLFVPEYVIYAFWEDIRGMTSPYVIIPRPKGTEEQSRYVSCTQDCFFLYAIPTSTATDKLPACTAVLEAMCEFYNKDVIHNMYDISLKIKYASDELDVDQVSRLLDLVRNNITTDFAVVFTSSINSFPDQAGSLVNNKSKGTWARIVSGVQFKSYQKRFESLLEALHKLDQ